MRRLVKALSGSVLLTIVTMSAPGTALAAQNYAVAPLAQNNSIKGTVSDAGVGQQENRNGPRHKTGNLRKRVVPTGSSLNAPTGSSIN